MGKAKTVVVDAAGHARAIAALSDLEGHFDADGKTRLAEQACDAADALTPIVPTLPEGAVESGHNGCICLTLDKGGATYRAYIWESGMSAETTYADGRAAEPAVFHLNYAAYLLHAWSNR